MSNIRRASFTLAVCSFLALATAAHANPVFDVGTSFTVSGNNAPDSFSQTATLATGNQFLDGGALRLNVSFAAATGGAEWVIFNFATTACDVSAPAGSKACNAPISLGSENFGLFETGIVLAQAANFSANYDQFNHNGTALTPTSSIFAGNPVETNPITGHGTGLGGNGFVDPLPAGALPGFGTFIDPFSFLGSTGIDISQVNGFEEAYLFTPTTPAVPEPSSLALMAAALCGLGLAARRRR